MDPMGMGHPLQPPTTKHMYRSNCRPRFHRKASFRPWKGVGTGGKPPGNAGVNLAASVVSMSNLQHVFFFGKAKGPHNTLKMSHPNPKGSMGLEYLPTNENHVKSTKRTCMSTYRYRYSSAMEHMSHPTWLDFFRKMTDLFRTGPLVAWLCGPMKWLGWSRVTYP